MASDIPGAPKTPGRYTLCDVNNGVAREYPFEVTRIAGGYIYGYYAPKERESRIDSDCIVSHRPLPDARRELLAECRNAIAYYRRRSEDESIDEVADALLAKLRVELETT